MIKHSSLQLKPLLKEWNVLDFAFLSLQTRRSCWDRWNVVHVPDVGGLSEVLVAIDFLLLVCPVWKWCCMSPHGNFAGVVNQLELSRETLELLSCFAVLNTNLEKCVVEAISISIINRNSGEFLVGWVVRRSHIM